MCYIMSRNSINYGDIHILRYQANKRRFPVCKAEGILTIDKPSDWTSFDVVNFVRSRFNIPKVGHCGTLDPAATGLLVLVLGKFTSLSAKLSADDKVYSGTFKLGVETDSADMDGEIIRECEVNVSEEEVRAACASFIGRQMQLPPMVSAVKVGGKKLYELARKGIEVEREAREIEIKRLEITRCELPECDFIMECSKGTYVRSFCSDLGKKLGCGGVLTALRRLRSGKFSLDDAVTIDTLKTMEEPEFSSMMAKRLVTLLGEHGL